MSASGGLGKLKQAAKDLKIEWEQARAVWNDENSRKFEQNFVLPFLTRVRNAETAMAHLDAVLQEVRRDCG